MNNVCFILDHSLQNYRIPLFVNLYKSGYNITVIHQGPKNINTPKTIRQIIYKRRKKANIEYLGIRKLNKYSIVVFMQNLRIIDLWFHTINPFRKVKIIHWGIGASSAKGLVLSKSLTSIIRDILSRFCSALILYTEAPKFLFSKSVLKKTFIANNTVESNIAKRYSYEDKINVLFIGTLNSRKGVDCLITAFYKFLETKPDNINKLVIVGDGPQKEELFLLVKKLKIEKNVVFAGQIFSENKKWEYFKNAAVSVSLKQAGLSVLECFSYGIPFICFKNAISGGEHLNIQNGINGYLINNKEELIDLLNRLDKSPFLIKELSHNAFNYYHEKRTMEQMVQSFINAFKFVTHNKDREKC